MINHVLRLRSIVPAPQAVRRMTNVKCSGRGVRSRPSYFATSSELADVTSDLRCSNVRRPMVIMLFVSFLVNESENAANWYQKKWLKLAEKTPIHVAPPDSG